MIKPLLLRNTQAKIRTQNSLTSRSCASTVDSFHQLRSSRSEIDLSHEEKSHYYFPLNKSDFSSSKGDSLDKSATVRHLSNWDKEILFKRSTCVKKKILLLNKEEKKDNSILSLKMEHNNKWVDKGMILHFEREKIKFETEQRNKLYDCYKRLIILKTKNKNFENVLNDTFRTLDIATTDYNLSVDVLKERIKSVQKYYENIKKNIEESNESKQKKDIINFEERSRRYSEYLAIVEGINAEIKEYDAKYAKIKEELTTLINEYKERIREIKEESFNVKKEFTELSVKEKDYYLNILKKGEDYRKEGLSWVVKKLLEINVNLEESSFPKFLDDEHINFLMTIANLKMEKEQLEKIKIAFQRRQKLTFQNPECDPELIMQNKFMDLIKSNNIHIKNTFFDNISKIVRSSLISQNKHDRFETILRKYYRLTKENCEKILSDSFLDKKIIDIRSNIIQGEKGYIVKLKKMDLYQQMQKEYEEDIKIINQRINEIETALLSLSCAQYSKYKSKYDYFSKRHISNKGKSEFKQIYNALFGMSLFIM